MTEQEMMEYIHVQYGEILKRESQPGIEERVLAGLIARESRGGFALTPQGPGGTGDEGHGRGLCQIDDRSHASWIATAQWWEPDTNIRYAVQRVLLPDYAYFSGLLFLDATAERPVRVLRSTLASYNCGPRLVRQCITDDLDVDTYTTGGNYSQEVIRLGEIYGNLPELQPYQVM